MSVTRPEPSNLMLADTLAEIQASQARIEARLGTGGGTGPGWAPGAPGAPNLTDAPGNQPFQVKPPVVRMPPIAERSDMIMSSKKGWERLGKAFHVLTLPAWLNNSLRNWEMNGGFGTPEHVQDQLLGLAVSYTSDLVDTGTGVDMVAVITELVKQYAAWQKDQAK